MFKERLAVKNFFFALAAAFFTGIFLWLYSDNPPYGPPGNELSNHSWGILIDIAHKWRSLSFSFWDRGVGGGTCLYSSGFYPIFHPTNFTALLLNDAHFFKLKVIEPYVAGVFFAVWVLLQTFRLRLPYALFGGFLYMGLGFGRFASLSDAPYFLWGCALFPFLVYVLAELRQRHWVSSAALAGCVLAVQFFLEGAPQIAQLLVWGLIFLTVYLLIFEQHKSSFTKKITNWISACSLFVFFAIGLAAIQFLPTYVFAFFESVRPYAGQYEINNFPLWSMDSVTTKGTVFSYFERLIVSPGGVSWRVIMALWLVALALIVTKREEFKKLFSREGFLIALGIATALHFLVPSVAGWIASLSPVAAKILKPISFITFAYSVHIIDFCMMLWLVFILDHGVRIRTVGRQKLHYWNISAYALGSLFILLPVLVALPQIQSVLMNHWPAVEVFIPASMKSAVVSLLLGSVLLGYFYFHPRRKWMKVMAYASLLLVGFMTMMLSFKWNDKGRQTHLASYHLDSPEVRYYHQAKGKYYLPVDDLYPYANNFNLLYQVDGTAGFLQVPPLRLNQFMASYHSDRRHTLKEWWVTKYMIKDPRYAISSRFPVDFTTVVKGRDLQWPGFSKKVVGQSYDIWEREALTERVYFASELKLIDFETMISIFDSPRGAVIHVLKDDAERFRLQNQAIVGKNDQKSEYAAFTTPRADRIQFEIAAPYDTFVVVPEIFQSGWEVRIDGKITEVFPADFLFVGFEAPKGRHEVTMRFIPPFLQLGILISAITLILLVLMLYRFPGRVEKPAG